MKTSILIFSIAFLSSCAAIDNYEIGDITSAALEANRKIAELKVKYCAEDNEIDREFILSAIRLIDKDYEAVCE